MGTRWVDVEGTEGRGSPWLAFYLSSLSFLTRAEASHIL